MRASFLPFRSPSGRSSFTRLKRLGGPRAEHFRPFRWPRVLPRIVEHLVLPGGRRTPAALGGNGRENPRALGGGREGARRAALRRVLAPRPRREARQERGQE